MEEPFTLDHHRACPYPTRGLTKMVERYLQSHEMIQASHEATILLYSPGIDPFLEIGPFAKKMQKIAE
ncbi:MAG: hypothetical protein LUQ38_03340 [Methanotrichaceae archaeon]|nr:hypothetical protein [Methanotrichaceae archaeon]